MDALRRDHVPLLHHMQACMEIQNSLLVAFDVFLYLMTLACLVSTLIFSHMWLPGRQVCLQLILTPCSHRKWGNCMSRASAMLPQRPSAWASMRCRR